MGVSPISGNHSLKREERQHNQGWWEWEGAGLLRSEGLLSGCADNCCLIWILPKSDRRTRTRGRIVKSWMWAGKQVREQGRGQGREGSHSGYVVKWGYQLLWEPDLISARDSEGGQAGHCMHPPRARSCGYFPEPLMMVLLLPALTPKSGVHSAGWEIALRQRISGGTSMQPWGTRKWAQGGKGMLRGSGGQASVWKRLKIKAI